VKILNCRKTVNGPWLQKEDQLCPDCGIVDPLPDNFHNNIREPFLNTLISNIQSRFEDADIINQLAILDLTGTDLIECMYGYTEMEALATYFDMDSRLFEKKIQYAPNNFLQDLLRLCRTGIYKILKFKRNR